MKTFRDSLIDHLDRSDVSVAELARKTGVSKDQLHKLYQRRAASTNVEDAIKIARHFGKTVEEFCDAPKNEDLSTLAVLFNGLEPDEREIAARILKGLASSR